MRHEKNASSHATPPRSHSLELGLKPAQPGLLQHSLCNSVNSSPASPEQWVPVEEGLCQANPLPLLLPFHAGKISFSGCWVFNFFFSLPRQFLCSLLPTLLLGTELCPLSPQIPVLMF